MKYKIISLVLCIPFMTNALPMGVAGSNAFNQGLENNINLAKTAAGAVIVKAGAKAVEAAGSAGQVFGQEAIKGAAEVVANGAVAAAPYAAGAAILGAACYGGYRCLYPSLDEQAARAESQLKECLKLNTQGERNSLGFPSACSEVALVFSILREKSGNPRIPKTYQVIEAFKEYN